MRHVLRPASEILCREEKNVPGSDAAAAAQDAEVAVYDPFSSRLTESEWWRSVAEFEARVADAADRAVEGVEAKVAKYQTLLDGVKEDLAEAKANAEKAHKSAAEATAKAEGR